MPTLLAAQGSSHTLPGLIPRVLMASVGVLAVSQGPGAKIHKTAIERELRALQLDEQPIGKILLVTGRSALQPAPLSN